jgi:tRNA pseudouridine32 synthase/23S rRNA pseudouridine746 synthase
MPAPLLLHIDDALLVALKPAGLPAVPGRAEGLQDCLASQVAAAFDDALVVHRLDMATSGLMLFARGKAMQRALSHAFAQRQVHKRYEAVVEGRVEPPTTADGWGTIELPLISDWPNRPKQKVDWTDGKPSLTRYRVLADEPALGASRLALSPVTGRSHQLRVHLLALGHPILGDTLYAPPAALAKAGRLLLHASELGFAHPLSGQALHFSSPAPF